MVFGAIKFLKVFQLAYFMLRKIKTSFDSLFTL